MTPRPEKAIEPEQRFTAVEVSVPSESNFNDIPSGVLGTISDMLSVGDRIALSSTCRHQRALDNSSYNTVGGFWHNYFAKLQALDERVVMPADGVLTREHIKAAYLKIVQRQNFEIKHFIELDVSVKETSIFIRPTTVYSPALTLRHLKGSILEQLQKRHETLEQINANIIKEHIKNSSMYYNRGGDLFLFNMGLTRIPERVFEGEDKKKWLAAKNIYLTNNHLIALPKFLGLLSGLKSLYCGRNALVTLPENIGSLAKLEKLYCRGNKLTTLPASIVRISETCSFVFQENPIYELVTHMNIGVTDSTSESAILVPSSATSTVAAVAAVATQVAGKALTFSYQSITGKRNGSEQTVDGKSEALKDENPSVRKIARRG